MVLFAMCTLPQRNVLKLYASLRKYCRLYLRASVSVSTRYVVNTHYLWPCDEPHQSSSVCYKQCLCSNHTQDAVRLGGDILLITFEKYAYSIFLNVREEETNLRKLKPSLLATNMLGTQH